MPLFWEKEEGNFKIEIWKMEEDVDELIIRSDLSPADFTQLESFQSMHRKREWLCVRMMLQRHHNRLLSGSVESNDSVIIYDEHGKPHLENSKAKISIAHTKDYVGIII